MFNITSISFSHFKSRVPVRPNAWQTARKSLRSLVNAQVAVATTGKIRDRVKRRAIDSKWMRILVMHEADHQSIQDHSSERRSDTEHHHTDRWDGTGGGFPNLHTPHWQDGRIWLKEERKGNRERAGEESRRNPGGTKK